MKKSIDKVFMFLMIGVTLITVYYVGFNNGRKNLETSTSGLILQVGDSYKLDVNNKDQEVSYKSTNEKVAKVDPETGNITAVGVGRTKIIETVNKEKVEYVVEVKKEAEQKVEAQVEEKKNVTEAIISEIAEQAYTGKEITPEVEVVLNNKELEDNIDYTVEYEDNIDEGISTVTVKGIGEYNGEIKKTFEIDQKPEGEKPQAVITCSDKVYNGLAQKIASCPDGVINNYLHQKVGEYTVTCKGNETHRDAESVTCSIKAFDLKNAKILSIANQKYSGIAIKPEITVMVGTTELKKDVDYTVSYANNISVGTATVTVTAKEKSNYTGSISATFEIKDEKDKALITCINPEYTGAKQVIARCTGGKIIDAEHQATGKYKVSCTGDSTHKDADSKECIIKAKDISKAVVNILGATKIKFTGSPITPKVTVKVGATTLKEYDDYELSYQNNTNVGSEAIIVVKGKGNYVGTVKTKFTIAKDAVITCTNPEYNGQQQSIATCSGGKINEKYKDVGKHTVTCTGDSLHYTAKKECTIAAKTTKSQTKEVPVTGVNANKTSLTINKGTGSTLSAVVEPKDAKQAVIWKSDKPNVVKVDSNGKITGVSKGTAVVTATSAIDSTKVAKIQVTVTVPVTNITLNKRELFLEKGKEETLQITKVLPTDADRDIKWTSTNTTVATVDQNGKVTAKAKGTATIKAMSKNDSKVFASVNLTVRVPVEAIKINQTSIKLITKGTTTLTKTITPSGVSNPSVTWASSNPKVATVDQEGKVTAVSKGTATITVTTADGGKKSTATVTVDNPAAGVTGVNIKESSLSVKVGESKQLASEVTPSTATNKKVTWASSNTKVATVDANGKVTGVSKGTVTITATSAANTAKKDTIQVAVIIPVKSIKADKTSISLEKGKTATIKATVEPSTATQTVKWTSTDEKVATVSSTGVVTAKGAGTANIVASATDNSGIKSNIKVTVTNPIVYATGITLPTSAKVEVSLKTTLKPTVQPGNVTSAKVTWASGNTKVATVDANGVVTGVSKGTATITATVVGKDSKKYTASTTVTVVVPATGITVSPTTGTVNVGKTISLKSALAPSTANPVTVTWTSSNSSIATVSSSGVVTGKGVGTVTITATITGKGNQKYTASAKITVKAAAPTATKVTILDSSSKALTTSSTITIKPSGSGNTVTFKAKVEPSSVSQEVTWTSSNSNIAKVDTTGKVTAVKQGVVTITATSKNNTKIKTSVIVKVQPTLSNINGSGQSSLKVEYESSTLKYWLERPSGTHYVVTHIWVEDAKSQMKVALTTPKSSGSNYPREIQIGGTIINNEIKNKGYQNKGLVAVNASPMNDGNLVKKSPVKWRGTQDIPLVINDGKVIRNSVKISISSSELTSTEKTNYNYNSYSSLSSYNSDNKMLSTFSRYVVFLDKSTGNLNYRWFYNPFLYGNSKWISDRNAKYEKDKETTRIKDASYYLKANDNNANYVIKNADYTFGFSPRLIVNGESANPDASKKANRQALCQIDAHNFILITSHLDGKSSESNSDSSSKYFCGPLINGKCPRVTWGLTLNDLSNIMVKYGCKTGVNLDGGGSTTYYYKNTKGTSSATRLPIQKENRGLADMLYFVEQ